jgi:hypothetical protein
MPKKKAPTRKPGETRGRKALVTINLTQKHSVNCISYGPGVARVSHDLAAVLLEQERNFHATERQLHEQGAALIGLGGKILKVRPGYFDQVLGSYDPDIRISGGER